MSVKVIITAKTAGPQGELVKSSKKKFSLTTFGLGSHLLNAEGHTTPAYLTNMKIHELLVLLCFISMSSAFDVLEVLKRCNCRMGDCSDTLLPPWCPSWTSQDIDIPKDYIE